MIIPIDIAELMLSHSALQANGDIERSAGRHSTADTRHGDDGDVLDLNIGGRLRDEHETLVQTEQKTFICLDRALDSAVPMMTVVRVSKRPLPS